MFTDSMWRYHKIGLVQKKTVYLLLEFIYTNVALVNEKNATELHVTANLDIGRKCSLSLQFISGCRRRFQACYRKAMPCSCLDLYISVKRGIYLLKRRYTL